MGQKFQLEVTQKQDAMGEQGIRGRKEQKRPTRSEGGATESGRAGAGKREAH
jgi:hypothetical protein